MHPNNEEYISRRIPVPEEFEEVFTHFYAAENRSVSPIHKTLLPSFQTILALSFGADISFTSRSSTNITLDKCIVFGPVKQPIDYTLQPGASMLVANFRSDGFYRFFGQAIISALPTHPDELLEENCFTHLWYNVKDLPTAEAQTQFILDFCKPYLRQRAEGMEQLIRASETDSPLNPIKTAAEAVGQTERNLQLKQKKYLGYSAKEINRYERFQKAMHIIQSYTANDKKPDWFDIIHDCGYYDQSQLIHDFQHFLHLSPMLFLKFQQDICRME